MSESELADAARALSVQLAEYLELKKRDLVTKGDLNAAEKRIIAAVTSGASTEDQALLKGLLARQEATATKLTALDALTPNT